MTSHERDSEKGAAQASLSADSDVRKLFFHEDDYCMLELVLLGQQNEVEEEMGHIATFSEEHRTEAGYTDVYVRKSDTDGLTELGIRIADIEAAVSSFAQPYDVVSTGYGSSYRVECPQIRAFGPNEETVLFCEHKDGILYKAWLTLEFEDRDRYEWSLKLLRTLAGLATLALADWSWGVHLELRDDAALAAYLENYVDEAE
ncbi:hypothetical protein [Saccharibacillus sacchari]|uniref:hypothetical protein n=1 Tax=Saccharibacillus sacchari TaxID=456493 RepID=UPI0004B8ABA2|nr:hypothetical protein [Saccharibacillus sacchari]